MNKVEAFQCSICKSVYADKKLARQCEKECKANRESQKIEASLAKHRNAVRNRPRLEATSICHLTELILDAIWARKGATLRNLELDVSYCKNISTRYDAPIGHKRARDTYVRGFKGKIRYKDNRSIKWDTFERPFDSGSGVAGIHTGTGGSRSGKDFDYEYDVTLFLDDFPKIKEALDEFSCAKEAATKEIYDIRAEVETAIGTDEVVLAYDTELAALHDQHRALENKINERTGKRYEYVLKKYQVTADEKIANINERINEQASRIMSRK